MLAASEKLSYEAEQRVATARLQAEEWERAAHEAGGRVQQGCMMGCVLGQGCWGGLAKLCGSVVQPVRLLRIPPQALQQAAQHRDSQQAAQREIAKCHSQVLPMAGGSKACVARDKGEQSLCGT